MTAMVEMTREDFEQAVEDAIDDVPDELLDLIDNCVILVEDEPDGDDKELLGLYDGVALTERGDLWAGALPDRILIYMNPTLRMCEDVDDVRDEVAITVVHEIAHHFGISDERLHALGWD
ncbi:metallopeptidase family protein [Demequina phytophila]|uniref:metallopeptidase family protein n=1 Tax=Demequina phytophila TaxID=1638981 RepID=UPI0014707332|nr:metallopeptidase family protein [Demequina phytophila]